METPVETPAVETPAESPAMETPVETPTVETPVVEAAETPEAPVPAVRTAGPPAVQVVEATQVHRQTTPYTEAWAQIVADPGHAPELLALAATQTVGPRAQDWIHRTREAYPTASDDALARLAVAQFTRFGSVGSVFAAVAGSYAPIALLGSNALTYAELILHVAAAYGLDPTDPRRAVDMLVLTQVHPTAADAEAAIESARQPAYEGDTTLTDAVWRLGRMAAAQAAAWTVLRVVNRFFPGTTMLAAVMTSRSGARNMGTKAVRYYSQSRKRDGSNV
jgi:hypothetical protein